MTFLRTIAAAVALLASTAHAALTPDPTGLWMDPIEPGWGLGLAQQGDVLFATLFVYDEARRPTFYVASDVRPDATGLHKGTLYRSSGPWFASDSNQAASLAPVGTISLERLDGLGAGGLRVRYTVGAVDLVKEVQPYSFVTCCGTLFGQYAGTIVFDHPPSLVCPIPPGLVPSTPHLTVDYPDLPNAFPLRLRWPTGSNSECSVAAPYVQQGQFGKMSGPVVCSAPLPVPVTLTVTEISNEQVAFYGMVSFQSGNCGWSGRIGGVRLP